MDNLLAANNAQGCHHPYQLHLPRGPVKQRLIGNCRGPILGLYTWQPRAWDELFHQHPELTRSARLREVPCFFSWRRLWEPRIRVFVLMARTRSKRTADNTDPGAGEGSRRLETEAARDAGGSTLSGERKQQIYQFVTENLPMLEDIIRQAKEGGEAGGAQTSKAKGKERGPHPIPSEDESRDQPPRRKRPRTPPRPQASMVGDSERSYHDRSAGGRLRNPSSWKLARNEQERSPARSIRSRPRDLPQWQPVRDELEQILRPQPYEDNYAASPFTREVEDYPLPRRFKIPNIELYDGSTDPEDHLSVFLTHMCLQTAADALRCKTFPMFLKGKARLWFQGLAPGSIRSFTELARQFAAQFVSSKTYSKNAAHLMAVKQKPDKSLKNFMTRFNTESLQIRDKDEKVVMAAFMNGLRVEELYYKHVEQPPKNLGELLTRAHAAANAEEAGRLKRESDRELGDRKGRANHPETKDGQARKNVFDRLSKDRAPAPPPLPEKGYTPLTRPRAQILAVMETEGLGDRSPKMGTPRNKSNQDRYCAFHRDVGHDTEGCWALKREIEDLVQRDFLGRFVRQGRPGQEPGRAYRGERGEGQHRDRPDRRGAPRGYSPDQDAQNLAGVINTIAGGPTGGDSHAARKSKRSPPEGDDSLKRLRMDEEITFGPRDAVPLASGNHEAIIIHVVTNNYRVKKVYVDQGSAVDIMFYRVFKELGLEDGQLTPVRTPLVGFTGPPVHLEGMINLMVMVGQAPKCRTIPVNFVVVKQPSPYNIFLGRPALNALRAIPSTLHLSVKFPTPEGIAEVHGDPEVARTCYLALLRGHEKVVAQTVSLEPYIPGEEERQRDTPDVIEEFPLKEGRPDQTIRIGASLPPKEKDDLKALLREYAQVFAWTVEDMPGIPTDLADHHLNIDPRFKPVKQKKRNFTPERNEVIRKEVGKLLESKIIMEVYYPTWLANPVLVKKEDQSWRMCVDFTDLNKACPKDCFPLPRIDRLVDATVGFDVLCFLDAFKGYHQIEMAEEDRENTSFFTEEGTYCYRTMPFGLKNAGATYQRLVNKLFQNQIGRNMEVYVDDMIVKSRAGPQLVPDLREILSILPESRMRLNPKKCIFGVRSGRFLGFLVSREGIRANPEKLQAIMDMAPPRSVKEVQRLTGTMAAQNRFLSRSAIRGLPFFRILKAPKDFQWTEECGKAFADLKAYLAELHTLTAPEQGDTLFLRALHGPETRYTPAEKLVLALVHAARKLRPYFQAHSIVVMTDQPLRQILTKPEVSGRMSKWAVELAEHDIGYRPRTAIKAQALADFLAEGASLTLTELSSLREGVQPKEPWVLFVDGASSKEGSGAGLLLISPTGEELTYALRFDFPASNNEAEYEALLTGLR
ncbi:uncharacterized protein [Coffea arabica]|uniref:RNA-directed DNA polymerase n=1 Tax=Coffea arabica TaxID=13443 RepID=A0ABM4UX40_COFAR